MAAVKVSDNVFWVGALDPGLRDFHGFEIDEGTTYNSYIVLGDDKVALVDTVNEAFVPEMVQRVREVIDPAQVDYIVVNHIEPDHGGGLVAAMSSFPNATVLCSAGAARAIPEFHGPDVAFTVVGPSDSVDLGGTTLRFMPMPMVHWPDSMFTYVDGSKTLLPNDAFGQHICTEDRFADEVGYDRTLEAADLYFANILMPLVNPINKAVEKLQTSGWDIETIAPSHGAIWRGAGVGIILEHYADLLSGSTRGSAVIAYATAWHSTEMIADIIAERLRAAGVKAYVFDLNAAKKSEVTLAVMRSSILIMGSATLHNAMLPVNAATIQYLAGLKPTGKTAAAFGSYGWSSGATAQIRSGLEAVGFDMPFEDLQVKYRPLEADIPVIEQWVDTLAKTLVP